MIRETQMKASALNKLMSSKTNLDMIYRLEFRRSPRKDVIEWVAELRIMVINCPTKFLTINGSLPDLLRGMTNLKSVSASTNLEIGCRPSKTKLITNVMPSIQKEKEKPAHPDNVTIMYDTVAKNNVVIPMHSINDIVLSSAMEENDEFYGIRLSVYNKRTNHVEFLDYMLFEKHDSMPRPVIKVNKLKDTLCCKVVVGHCYALVYANLIWPNMLNVIIDSNGTLKAVSYMIHEASITKIEKPNKEAAK